MKKTVTNFIRALGGRTRYSGNTKTMFIDGPESIEAAVIQEFGYGLPFKLSTN